MFQYHIHVHKKHHIHVHKKAAPLVHLVIRIGSQKSHTVAGKTQEQSKLYRMGRIDLMVNNFADMAQ